MRVNHVEKARKSPGQCGQCRKEIAVGQPYKWAKGRFGPKMLRCGGCVFRRSSLTTSKMSSVYAAVESLEDLLEGWDGSNGSVEDVQMEVDIIVEEAESVASEYEEAAEAMQSAGESQQERAEALRDWIGSMEGLDLNDYEKEDDADEVDTSAPKFVAWKDGIIAEVASVLGDCP